MCPRHLGNVGDTSEDQGALSEVGLVAGAEVLCYLRRALSHLPCSYPQLNAVLHGEFKVWGVTYTPELHRKVPQLSREENISLYHPKSQSNLK